LQQILNAPVGEIQAKKTRVPMQKIDLKLSITHSDDTNFAENSAPFYPESLETVAFARRPPEWDYPKIEAAIFSI
jgi:hypothetical protein